MTTLERKVNKNKIRKRRRRLARQEVCRRKLLIQIPRLRLVMTYLKRETFSSRNVNYLQTARAGDVDITQSVQTHVSRDAY